MAKPKGSANWHSKDVKLLLYVLLHQKEVFAKCHAKTKYFNDLYTAYMCKLVYQENDGGACWNWAWTGEQMSTKWGNLARDMRRRQRRAQLYKRSGIEDTPENINQSVRSAQSATPADPQIYDMLVVLCRRCAMSGTAPDDGAPATEADQSALTPEQVRLDSLPQVSMHDAVHLACTAVGCQVIALPSEEEAQAMLMNRAVADVEKSRAKPNLSQSLVKVSQSMVPASISMVPVNTPVLAQSIPPDAVGATPADILVVLRAMAAQSRLDSKRMLLITRERAKSEDVRALQNAQQMTLMMLVNANNDSMKQMLSMQLTTLNNDLVAARQELSRAQAALNEFLAQESDQEPQSAEQPSTAADVPAAAPVAPAISTAAPAALAAATTSADTAAKKTKATSDLNPTDKRQKSK